MKNFFIGFIFILLNFNLTLNNSVIGLLPSFVGYYFLMKGLREFENTSTYFNKITPLVPIMIVYSAICYVTDLIGLTTSVSIYAFVFGLISMMMCLYISYHIVLGINDLEASTQRYMNAALLFSRWKMMAAFQVASFLFVIIPFMALIFIVINLITTILFLIAFNNAKNSYY